MDPALQQLLLGISGNLLSASGPSPTPITLGQAVGGAINHGLSIYDQAMQHGLQNKLLSQQIERNQKTLDQADQTAKFYQNYAGILSPTIPVNPTGGPKNPQDQAALEMMLSGNPQLQQQGYNILSPNPVKLGAGDTLYSPRSGQAIYTAPNKPAEMPSDVRSYQYAVGQGYGGTYEQWKQDMAKAGASKTTVNLGENAAATEIGKKGVDEIFTTRQTANDAVDMLQSNNEAKKLLDSGMITGFGADLLTNFGSALQQIGFNAASDPVSNTQAYVAASAKRVAGIIKAFGSGTGLSDADREYASNAAAGNITLTDKSLKKIIDINDRAAKYAINKYNHLISTVNPEVKNAAPFPLELNVDPSLMNGADNGWTIKKLP